MSDGITRFAQRFRPTRDELGWIYPNWKWDRRSEQCVPQNTVIKAENDEYIVEAEVEIGDRQVPIISDKTIGTRIYFIQEHFPHVTGTMTNKETGRKVKFSGLDGGEFLFSKNKLRLFEFPRGKRGCKRWGNHS